MRVSVLTHPVSGPAVAQLQHFERQFHYPLGPTDHFSISHGRDYLQFFVAMGTATLLVAEHRGIIVGTLVLVRRCLVHRPGDASRLSHHRQVAHYICDLKVRPDARSSPALARLLAAAAEIVRPHASYACYGIVMSGTRSDPSAYTGRLGVPNFSPLGEVAILRFLTDDSGPGHRGVVNVTPEQFTELEAGLPVSGVQPIAGEPSSRSQMPAERFCHSDATACGLLEDTRLGKRLFRASGEELISAHLSRFLWSNTAAAVDVLRHAIYRTREWGYPALFCSVPLAQWSQLKPLFHDLACQETAATVYGYQIPQGLPWWIDTSEI